MLDVVRFCPGCNDKFEVDASVRSCPNCRQPLATLPLGSTRDVDHELVNRGSTFGGMTADLESDDAPVGKQIAHYTIEEFLGSGGMARVYRARHDTLHRDCALKLLNRQLVDRDPRFVELFFAEARSAASLAHPNVVTIHNIGEWHGHHFIEMEYVKGRSLREEIAAARRLRTIDAAEILVQVCAALAEAHRLGLVHRDVKPGNILVTGTREAKLADFGLAKRIVAGENTLDERGLTGTPYYMGPELFLGSEATPQSDVYAFGITFFHALTGSLPFVARGVTDLAAQHRNDQVPALSSFDLDVPKEIEQIIATCLEKNASRRYPDAGALLEELRLAVGQLRNMDRLISEALSTLGVSWAGRRGRYEIVVSLPHDRSQRVYIEVGESEPLLGRLVRIYSICAPLTESYYRRALELNADMPHGSIAIQDVAGEPHFIMVDTYPQATCDREEIRRSVMTVARWSDDVEKVLTKGDRF